MSGGTDVSTHISQHDDPVVSEQVGDGVDLDDGGQAGNRDPVGNDASHDEQANIGDDDEFLLLLLEQGRVGRVVLQWHVQLVLRYSM